MSNKNFNKYLQLLAVLSLVLSGAILLPAQKYKDFPVTKARLLRSVRTRDVAVDIVILLVKKNGVDFKLTPEVEQEFVAVKANRAILNAIRDNYRAPAVAATTTGSRRNSSAPAANTNTLVNTSENTSEPENTDEKYEELFNKSQQLAGQFNPTSSQQQIFNLAKSLNNVGNQEIKLNPARFEGYRTVAFSYILTGDFIQAERYGQMAIDRGGSLKFGVWHIVPGNVHLDILHVAKGLISVENLDGKYNPFYNREVTGFQVYPNPIDFQGVKIAGFSVFTNKNNTRLQYDFAPYTTNSIEEAEMIKRLVQANINK
jgi:hypothetical protein